MPEFDAELKKFNLELGKKLEASEVKVVYVRIKELRPKTLSRIEDMDLESAVAG